MASNRGFTLLEVLVVLVITSMLSLLLIDGVGQVLMIEQRLGARTREFRSEQLQQFWFRQVFAGAIASLDHPFEMKGDTVTGFTLSPLISDQGVPRPFELELVNTGPVTELRYREGAGEAVVLMRWPASQLINAPQFLAVDDEGSFGTQWVSKEGGPQWPAGIALRMPLLEGEEFWHAAIVGRRTPRRRISDELGI